VPPAIPPATGPGSSAGRLHILAEAAWLRGRCSSAKTSSFSKLQIFKCHNVPD